MTDDQAATEAVDHRARLGTAVRELRRARGLTLRDLAADVGVSPATMSAVENGLTGVSSARLGQLARILRVSVERLLDPAPRPASPPPAVEAAPTATGELTAWPGGDWRAFEPLRLDPALAGALSSFLEFGYHGASVRSIAERSGLSVPGLYHYYDSKHEMLVALFDLVMNDLQARTVAARDEGRDPVERFTNIVECLALVHTHHRELAFVGASEMRGLQPPTRARVAALRVEEQRMIDLAVEDGVSAGVFATTRPHEAARAVVTMCTALAQWWHADGPASAEEVAAQYVGFALDLVRHRPADPAPADS